MFYQMAMLPMTLGDP